MQDEGMVSANSALTGVVIRMSRTVVGRPGKRKQVVVELPRAGVFVVMMMFGKGGGGKRKKETQRC